MSIQACLQSVEQLHLLHDSPSSSKVRLTPYLLFLAVGGSFNSPQTVPVVFAFLPQISQMVLSFRNFLGKAVDGAKMKLSRRAIRTSTSRYVATNVPRCGSLQDEFIFAGRKMFGRCIQGFSSRSGQEDRKRTSSRAEDRSNRTPTSRGKKGFENRVEHRASSPDPSSMRQPWVRLKYVNDNPCVFASMVQDASPEARAGDLVHLYNSRTGAYVGRGLFDPHAKMPLRIYHHHQRHQEQARDDGDEEFGEAGFAGLLHRAVDLRTEVLRLQERTDAFRVINSDGDGLSGLIVDKYADVLSVEAHSVGVYQRLREWIPLLHSRLGTSRHRISTDIRREGTFEEFLGHGDDVRHVVVKEDTVQYEVNFESGHKTGFFCDQRDNRRRFGQLARGRTVLDVCCYTGGFSIAAAKGGAKHVTAVDLDEEAIAQARRNAEINQVATGSLRVVHADAFVYARQLEISRQQFDVVLCDPPKFLGSRDPQETARGMRKYEDLNALATSLVAPGGLLVTCSCSGLLSEAAFEEIVVRAAHKRNRRLQVLDRTGPGQDHPVLGNCPESRYLKVVWARLLPM